MTDVHRVSAAVSLVLGALVAAAMLLWAQVRIPFQPMPPLGAAAESIDFEAMFGAVDASTLSRLHGSIVSAPARLTGGPAERALAEDVARRFEDAGCAVILQHYPVTVPVTRWCRLVGVDGAAQPGIELSPLWPNLVRTCTVDPDGLTGEVVDAGTGTMDDLQGVDVAGRIALVRMAPGFGWMDAARLGAAAILFRPASEPAAWRDKFLDFPADLPRFVVRGPAEELVGRRVRIAARVDWVAREALNVYGVLRPSVPTLEALTLIAHTDSWSPLPDTAPGYQDACGLAALLAIAEALGEQREGLSRTVVFAALAGRYQASAGSRRMCDALGARPDLASNRVLLAGRRDAAQGRLAAVEAAAAAVAGRDYWALDDDQESALWRHHGQAGREALSTVVQRVVDRYIDATADEAGRARIAWAQADRPTGGPVFDAMQVANKHLRRAKSAAGADVVSLKRHFPDVIEAAGCRDGLVEELATTRVPVELALRCQQDTIRLADLYGGFDKSYYFVLELGGAGGQLGYVGDGPLCDLLETARDTVVATWLRWRGAPHDDPSVYADHLLNRRRSATRWGSPAPVGAHLTYDPTWPLSQGGHAAFTFNGRVVPEAWQTPVDVTVDFDGLAVQVQLLAGLSAQMGAGAAPMSTPGKAASGIVNWFSDYGGRAVATGSANSMLPTQPVAGALVVLKGAYGQPFYFQKTHDGIFRFPAVEAAQADAVLAEAYTIDERTGRLNGARDLGPEGERFPTQVNKKRAGNLFEEPTTRVTVMMARLAPMDIYRTIDPDGRPLTLELLDARFRSPPMKFGICEYWEQGATVFVEPGDRFYVLLKNLPERGRFYGQTGAFTQGFMLGHRPGAGPPGAGGDFWGPGYLAGQDRRVVFAEVDQALSVAASNDVRLASQVRAGVADPVNVELAGRARALLDQGLGHLEAHHHREAYRDLTASLAVSNRAYPAIRTAVYDAMSGILLYLFLLVPFSFFAERLLFAFRDIRARLAGMFGIFLAAFGVIRFTHPAYGLMTSSLIVLVGFVILLLCLLILGFVLGKFTERIRALRRAGGAGGEADVSRLSASGAAFVLGISNMRKRKVRTAYTMATLVLISFCLVCFTAPRPQMRDRRIAVGPADFNGMILRDGGDLAAARLRFKGRGELIARRATMRQTSVSWQPAGGPLREVALEGLVEVQSAEARVSGIERLLLPGGAWFDDAGAPVCYLSDMAADQLGIDPATVRREDVHVVLDGRRLAVYGVFDSARLDAQREADGESFLPEESGLLSALERDREKTRQLAGHGDAGAAAVQYLPAASVALLPLDAEAGGDFTSAVVLFEDMPYGRMRDVVQGMLERTPTFVRYAVDRLSFFAARLRSIGLEGYVDIVVPLLIASCIVFNTMLGSVHEREKEISIYAAVGLSPRHVFFLFLAESLVYAVVGVVGGYLLALVLQWLNQVTGGLLRLNIDYSSRSAIYVSLTLMGAVIVSTFVPAARAARVASPSERVTWRLPAASGPGRLLFDLPFTFRGRDVMAATAFLTDWFDAHGEDSSGAFAASPPRPAVGWPSSDPVFTVGATVWLRPYDLGVSQQVAIHLRPSREASIYTVGVAIDRASGGDVAWHRTNARFVALLRRHLLSWRALSARHRRELFERAVHAFGQTTVAGPQTAGADHGGAGEGATS